MSGVFVIVYGRCYLSIIGRPDDLAGLQNGGCTLIALSMTRELSLKGRDLSD